MRPLRPACLGAALLALAAGQALAELTAPPTAPSGDADAGPDDEVEWQRVLVRDLCG